MSVETESLALSELNIFSENCPTRKILDLLSDKWLTLIIILLHESPKRFSELHRQIGGISQKMLTQNLRNLERAGMVTRTVFPEVPPRVEYSITSLGESFYKPISAVQQWTEKHYFEVLAAQHDYDHKGV